MPTYLSIGLGLVLVPFVLLSLLSLLRAALRTYVERAVERRLEASRAADARRLEDVYLAGGVYRAPRPETIADAQPEGPLERAAYVLGVLDAIFGVPS
jgi:hypothetical protein